MADRVQVGARSLWKDREADRVEVGARSLRKLQGAAAGGGGNTVGVGLTHSLKLQRARLFG